MNHDKNLYLERKFSLNGDETVIARVWFPYQENDKEICQDYQCDFQIIGLGSTVVRHAMGVDEIQAVYLALQRLGIILYASAEYKAGSLAWLGNSDLGLPMPNGASDYVI